ncbi:MAG: response regulator [Bdellovibrionales bacterium]|nr:response regulator [Bdellovibrionales bacterium]
MESKAYQLTNPSGFANKYFDAMSTKIFVLDMNGVVAFTNKSWTDFELGKGETSLSLAYEGLEYLDLCKRLSQSGDKIAEKVLLGLESILSGQNQRFLMDYLWKSTNDEKWYLLIADPIGKPLEGLIISHIDITSKKKLQLAAIEKYKEKIEELSKNLNTQTKFLASLEHEIRNPLMGIIGYSELLNGQNNLPDEQKIFSKQIFENAKSLESIINNHLDLSQLEFNNFEIKNQPLIIHEFIREIIDEVIDVSIEKNILLNLHFSKKLPHQVLLDSVRFKQVVRHLLDNALKYTKEGRIDVFVDCEALEIEETTCHIKIFVDDTGVGISKENQKMIFQICHQTELQEKIKDKMIGFGLPLTKKIARAMGGNIQLGWSQPGVGSQFIFDLPKVQIYKNISNQPEKSSAKSSILKGLKILSIEDSEDLQFLIEDMVKQDEAQCEMAYSGKEGVRKALSGNFDLVLLDINLPTMDGFRVARLLRRLHFHQPIICITGDAKVKENKIYKKYGIDACLTKPFHLEQLNGVAQQLVH